jgi:hypothetical protein
MRQDRRVATPYDEMARVFEEHAQDSPYNAHYGRPAVLALLGAVAGLCAAVSDAGFLIERLVEPLPAESMRERWPEHLEKLSREPGFLVLRLAKPLGRAAA